MSRTEYNKLEPIQHAENFSGQVKPKLIYDIHNDTPYFEFKLSKQRHFHNCPNKSYFQHYYCKTNTI